MKLYWFLFLLCPLLNAITGAMIFNVIFMILGCTSFIYIKKFSLYTIVTCIFISAIILIVQYFSVMDDIFRPFLYFISSFISSYVFIKARVYVKFQIESILLFIILLSYIYYHVFIGSDLNGSDVFEYFSRNYISIYSLFYFSIFCLCNVKNNKLIAFFLILNLLMICFTFSRSGILTSSMLIFALLFKDSFKLKWKISFLMLSILPMLILILYSDVYEIISDRIIKQGFGDTGRQDILSCYYNNFNLENFLFGINYNGNNYCGTLGVGSYSLHNSFLSLYSFLGIVSIIIFVFIFKTVWNLKNKTNLYLMFVFIIYLLRSSTDSVLFFSPFDFVFWLFFFYSSLSLECLYKNEKTHI